MDAVSTGRALGSRYLLQERLGGGAMGEVWRTLDRTTGTEVAAKLLRGEHTRDPAVVGRFVQERSILLALDHPHVVRVRDLVVEGDDLAIVMDLVEGSDLRRHLQDAGGTLPPAEAVRITVAVLEALAYAHQQSCLHRDVKPDNVLLGGGRVLLTDFGIARLAAETNVRATGALGTPEYMAPEVFTLETVSPAADVYGAGAMLYELLAGRTPFAGGTNGYAVINRHVNAQPPVLQGIPAPLWAVLVAMLEKDPARRTSAEAAAKALVELDLSRAERLPVQPTPPTWEPVGGLPAPELDAAATTVRGVAAPQAVLPTADGELPAAPAAELDASSTTLAAPRPVRQAPTLAPEAVPAPPKDRRTPLLVAGGVVALVGVVAAAVVLVPRIGGGSGGDDTAATEVTAQVPDEVASTGLTTARSATRVKQGTRVDVTWTAGRSAVQGPFYESVPVDADHCQVGWDSDAVVTPSTVTGIAGPCGWSVAVGALAAGQTATASYVVPVKAKDAAALKSFLTKASDRTAEDLTGKAQLADYAAQRLDRVVLEAPTAVVAGSPVPVRLLPVWRGVNTPDPRNVLFDSTVVGASSTLLDQVAGGLKGVTLTAVSCTGALSVDRRLYPVTDQPDTGCVLAARVGDLEEADSSPFDITYRSG